jgi:hypothetical protein
MADLASLIGKFIKEEIALNQKDISASVKSRKWFLEQIKNEISERTDEPSLYSTPFVYFGSYFKGTKVSTVDEFDVLVVIDSNSGQYTMSGLKYGDGLGDSDPNHKYDKKYKKSDGSGVSPSILLNWLKGIVETVTKRYGGQSPERNRQAVTAYIKSKDLDIDLVPAGIFSRTSDESTFYNIPRGDKNNGWIITSPREDIDLLNSVAKGKDNYRNIIRLAKFMKSKERYNFVNVTSFAVESAVVKYGQNYKWNNKLDDDFLFVLKYLSNVLSDGKLSDPYNTDNNLLEGADNKKLQWYSTRIDNIIAELNSLKTEEDDEKAYGKFTQLIKNE